MGTEQTIAVVGATGAQGGGFARAILDDPDSPFRVRALTRNPDSDRAAELARNGAEVVAADLDDPESLNQAFQGVYGAYCVTNFWEHLSPERELAQAENMARAAKKTGVKHVIWSTLEDTRQWVPLEDDRMPTLMGNYKVPHFDAKGEANRYFTSHEVPTTFLFTSFYWDNLINLGMGPKRQPDGGLAFTLPMGDKKLPGIASEDIGRCAYGVYRRNGKYISQAIGIAGEHLTGQEMAEALTEALGEEVRFNDITPEQYRGFDFPGAEDLANMFQFKRDFNEYYCGVRDLEKSRALNPQLQSFRDWLERNKDRIPVD